MNTFFLSNTPLFHGISESEISELLSCLGAKERKYKKDEIIIRAGSSVSEIGLVESGSVNIVVNFYWGNSHIFGHVGKGQVFAENYAAIPGKELLCDVVACEETEVLFLSMRNMLTTCPVGTRIPYPHHSEYASDFRTEEPESLFAHDAYRVKISPGTPAFLSFGAGAGTQKLALYHSLPTASSLPTILP